MGCDLKHDSRIKRGALSAWQTRSIMATICTISENFRRIALDLIYLDPPFNSKATYNLLFRTPEGIPPEAQTTAFKDTWAWNPSTDDAFDYVIASGSPATPLLRAFKAFLGNSDMMAYLCMMAARLIELRRILKQTGALYLHCDPTVSHYLKILIDGVRSWAFCQRH
jgi:site-specific DNA-methyltransferase (adenine-specific)